MYGVKIKTMRELSSSGETGDCTELTLNHAATGQPSDWTTKDIHHDLLADTFDPDLDMRVFDDFGVGITDSLGDGSMDSFTDLTTLLPVSTLLDQTAEEEATPSTFLSLDKKVKGSRVALKRTYDELDDTSSDIGRLTARVLSQSPSLDHDYPAKRLRTSLDDTESHSQAKLEDTPTASPSPLVAPSPSTSDVDIKEKRRQRREKNNVASRRSREIRKKKFSNMEKDGERLSEDNARLERQVQAMEGLAQRMKDILVARMGIKS